jgi:hypothetical protein
MSTSENWMVVDIWPVAETARVAVFICSYCAFPAVVDQGERI